jgi:hypothetical protein
MPGLAAPRNRGAAWTGRWLLGLAFLILVYGPALYIPYAHHDQLRYFWHPADPGCDSDVQHERLLALGRPVAAYLECLAFRDSESLEDLFFYRWMALGLLSLGLVLLARALEDAGLSRIDAGLLAAALMTLPGVENAIYMANVANALAILLAVMAALLFRRAQEPTAPGSPRYSPAWLSAAALTLLAALCTYQPLAFFFLVPLMARLQRAATPLAPVARSGMVGGLAVLAATSAVYVAAVKVFPFSRVWVPESYRFETPALELADKLALFWTQVVPRVFSFWNVSAAPFFGWTILATLVALVLMTARTAGVGLRAALAGAVARLLAAATLLLAGLAVWLLSPFTEVLQRILLPSMAMALVFAFLVVRDALATLGRPAPATAGRQGVVPALLLAVGALQISCLHDRNVWNSAMEAKFIETQLAMQVGPDTRRIHLVRPAATGYGYDGHATVGDEFHRNSADYPWHSHELVRVGLLRLMPPYALDLVHCRLPQRQCVQQQRPGTIVITASGPGEAVYESPGTVVVDLNALLMVSGRFPTVREPPPP